MPLFTCVLEFGGGTYIAQVRAASVAPAKRKWISVLLDNDAIGKLPIRKRLAQTLNDESVVAVEGVRRVWCCSTSVSGRFALLNIVETAD